MLIAVAACALARCTVLTHAEQYSVGLASLECYFCPTRPDLRHPPCPPGNPPPDGTEMPGRHVFALRSLDMGIDAATWKAGYRVGRDLDCSDRPNGGTPDTCTTFAVPSGGAWVRLPNGIDNAFATQYVAPLAAEGFDLEGELNRGLTEGNWGLLLTLDGWNGQPDDASVAVSFVFTQVSLDGGIPPRFDPTDRWTVCGAGVDGGLPSSATVGGGIAYVVKGQLVWDFQGPRDFYLWNHGAQLEITLLRGVLVADLSASGLANASLSGVWTDTGIIIPPEFMAGCDRAETVRFACDNAVFVPPDVHLPSDSPTSTRCRGTSIGIGMSFVPTSTDIETSTDNSACFTVCSYGQPDCGAD